MTGFVISQKEYARLLKDHIALNYILDEVDGFEELSEILEDDYDDVDIMLDDKFDVDLDDILQVYQRLCMSNNKE